MDGVFRTDSQQFDAHQSWVSVYLLRPGDRFTHRGQEYTLLAFTKDNRPGPQYVMLLLQTNCADWAPRFT